MKLRGLYTAIVTPFDADGELDQAAFLRLIDMQIAGGVNGIVVTGSTGEGATTTTAEKERLWSWAVEHVAGRVSVIAGTGTNDTRSTIELTALAKRCGAQAALLVTPYYNKPTQAGIIAHHKAVADAVDLPQIMYNVPGRTATNVLAETQIAIAEASTNVVATKEASANLEQISEIIRNAPAHFSVLAGDDVLALPTIACGGTGVIAVISNYLPVTYADLVGAALKGDVATAGKRQRQLMPYYKANFIESNPVPVKYIMHRLGYIGPDYRLPLVPPLASTRAALDALLLGISDPLVD
ncbi:MAG: 4-hydroxy-tetrahydrodipicolinate synthase ['Candidatus Kapabacteria' thiocyanatum]|uniref:4-hydroxy-tetrahydrodipicolinate synthase n=1 Tax=Candidatus Kapaibacterium thiocyanatum TaxID=1895771 RepID=A0A1M3KYK6_9BACT|nr:4-hydroxy-tetrahydrodipicolinate synthase ['Candidatus Kapabacteria' thiocyanatum]OJX57598.1 MAG: 4-hydroxy-tetrahydrodipicolinate synthase ['Candidatus Kapabacteria' thiocyanatum]